MYIDDIFEYCFKKVKGSNLTYLLGANDTRKTTLIKELSKQLLLENKSISIIDADIGQSSILPLTINLLYADRPFQSLDELKQVRGEFIPEYEMKRYVVNKLLRKEEIAAE